MKRKIVSVMLAAVLTVSMAAPVAAQEAAGSAGIEMETAAGETVGDTAEGEASGEIAEESIDVDMNEYAAITPVEPSLDGDNYYLIDSKEKLYWFAGLVNGALTDGTVQNKSANARLMADITVNENVLDANGDLNGDGSSFEAWTPIGNYWDKAFSGVFDGNKHTISGLYFYENKDDTYNSAGLFGHSSGTIRDVGVLDSYFSRGFAGAICGINGTGGKISGCWNASTISSKHSSLGGICGQNAGSISACFNCGKVSAGKTLAGGICGNNWADVSDCYNIGAVMGTATGSGGLVGDSGATNSYYIDTCGAAGSGTSKTADQFASGEVAWLLNGGENQSETPVWYQTLGTDAYPTLDSTHGRVYRTGTEGSYTYTNTKPADPPALVDGYYQISTKGELYWFANAVNSGQTSINAKLTADITINSGVLKSNGDLNGDGSGFEIWTPIGTDSKKYAGIFDGQDHVIKGLYYNDINANYIGLFGFSAGSIKNVAVEDSYIHGNYGVGGICGWGGNIENCINAGNIEASGNYAGGICGRNGNVSNCKNIGKVSGGTRTGGIIGWGIATGSQNSGTVNGTDAVGGIIGYFETHAAKNCFNTGNVSGTTNVGGIAGFIESGAVGVQYSWSSGLVAASGASPAVGGIAGYAVNDSKLSNCYYLSGSENDSYSGTTFKTEAQFASGEVAWLLNGGENQSDTPVWYQNIDSGTPDAYPTPDSTHGRVYRTGTAGSYSYTNTKPVDPPALVGGYYQIGTKEELYWFAGLVNGTLSGTPRNQFANVKLTADITVNENVIDTNGNLNEGTFEEWIPIGNYQQLESNFGAYGGTFDGQGHTISGLYYDGSGWAGLFAQVTDGTVQNVGIRGSYIKGSGENMGAVCGTASASTISGCFNESTVIGRGMTGGIAGRISNTTVRDCYNAGHVTGKYDSTSDMSHGADIGGIVAQQLTGNSCHIISCYNAGEVKGRYFVGSIVGVMNKQKPANCCYLVGSAKDDSGVAQSGIGCGTPGQTTSDEDGVTAKVNAFSTGEATWLLNGGENQSDTPVWFQNIDSGTPDAYPTLDSTHGRVYRTGTAGSYSYSNTAPGNV